MAQRDPWAVSSATGLLDVEECRIAMGSLWTPGSQAYQAKTGFRPGPGSPGLVTATGTPNGFVHIAPHQLVIQSGRATGAGAYVCTADAITDINVLSTPANGSNPRDDLIIAQVSDAFYGDSAAIQPYLIKQIVGTPSGTPVQPTVTGSPDYAILAKVRVRANTTSILSTDITDMRPSATYTVGVGGLLPIPSQAARATLTGVYDGMQIWRTDRRWVEVYTNATWRVQGIGTVTSAADFAAITSPYTGQVVFNSGDSQMWVYDSAGWHPQVGATLRGAIPSSGVLQSSISTTEKDIPRLALANVTLSYNYAYRFRGQIYTTGGGANDGYFLRVRLGTALTGTNICSMVMVPAATAYDQTYQFDHVWVADALYVGTQINFSMARGAGAGTNMAVDGNNFHTYSCAEVVGPIGATDGVWALT